MIKIIIPTLGRVNKQISFNNLPLKYKKLVYFVVRKHEYEEIKNKYENYAGIIILPKNIEKGLAPTKIYILEYFKNDKIWIIDDDLTFCRKIINENNIENKKGKITKWLSPKMVEKDFDELFEKINNFMNKDNIVHLAIQIGSTPPSKKYYPININGKIGGNVFFNVPKLPNDVEYYKYCKAAEDYETNIQLLKKGYKNIILTDFVATEKTDAPGGCSIYRDVNFHNESQLELIKRHSDVVKINEKKKKKDNEEKINVKIYWKKAYNNNNNIEKKIK